MKKIKIKSEYDKEVDAAYIYLKNKILPKEVKNTISLNDDINLDFDRNQKLIGIEILNASKVIPKKVIKEKLAA